MAITPVRFSLQVPGCGAVDAALVAPEAAPTQAVFGGGHSFDVLVRSGRTQDEVRAEFADTIAGWIARQPVSA